MLWRNTFILVFWLSLIWEGKYASNSFICLLKLQLFHAGEDLLFLCIWKDLSTSTKFLDTWESDFPFLVAWNRVTLFLAWCTTVNSYLQPKFLYPWGRRQFIAFCTSWCCCGLIFYWAQTNRNYHKNKGWALTDVCWFQEVFLLSSNSAKTRQAALESLKSAFSSKILYEFIMERRMTLTDSIERCIKKGN